MICSSFQQSACRCGAGIIRRRHLLEQGLDEEIRLPRDEALLAQAFAEDVADIVTGKQLPEAR